MHLNLLQHSKVVECAYQVKYVFKVQVQPCHALQANTAKIMPLEFQLVTVRQGITVQKAKWLKTQPYLYALLVAFVQVEVLLLLHALKVHSLPVWEPLL